MGFDDYNNDNEQLSTTTDLGQIVDWSDASSLNVQKLLPAGDYVLVVTDGLVKPSKLGEYYARLCFQVVGGSYNGHSFAQAFFLVTKREDRNRFFTLREACGLPTDTPGCIADFIDKRVLAKVTIKEKNNGGQCNTAETFFPYVTSVPTQTSNSSSFGMMSRR